MTTHPALSAYVDELVETLVGTWVSKPEAADWLRGKVRIALEEAQ